MKTFHNVFQHIIWIAILNLILFFLASLILGGDAINGKVEGSHYYLGNHGQFTEVNYFVFGFSKLQVYSVFISFPLAMITGFIYMIIGGRSYRPKPISIKTFQLTNNIFDNIIQIIHYPIWKIIDLLWTINWIILDSWRKPDDELFVKIPKQQCINDLNVSSDNDYVSFYNLEKPLLGIFSNYYFCLQKWNYSPWVRDGGIRPVLSGRFYKTPHGTYIKMWHRFATEGIFFLTMWFGTAFSLLFYFFAVPLLLSFVQGSSNYLIATIESLVIVSFYVGTLLITIWIGSAIGRAKDRNIIDFVKIALNS